MDKEIKESILVSNYEMVILLSEGFKVVEKDEMLSESILLKVNLS